MPKKWKGKKKKPEAPERLTLSNVLRIMNGYCEGREALCADAVAGRLAWDEATNLRLVLDWKRHMKTFTDIVGERVAKRFIRR
ncbi:MAG: hypothetical protein R3B52_02420 [Candidatus Paceibacterota bacterium]